jgi:hypothetical protein
MAEWRNRGAVAAVVALALLLTACVSPPRPDDDQGDIVATALTLEEAKTITLQREAEIASYFPKALVAESRVTETSQSLYGCPGEDNFSWPSVTVITIQGEPDHDAIIASIAEEWGGRAGWTVTRGTNAKNDLPTVVLENEDGSRFTVGFYLGGAEFWVDSASPCFHLEGGLEPGTEY